MTDGVPPGPALSPSARSLVASAHQWISASMAAWADDDYAKVAALAPLGLEQLGKALLWEKHPTLLAPLDRQHEASLVLLATQPDLTSPKLRTIGLAEVLARLQQVVKTEPPVDRKRRTRIVSCRNGAMHVGQSDPNLARRVLVDVLAMANWLLAELGYSESTFYATSYEDVRGLLDRRRTEVQHAVAAKVARAKRRHDDLRRAIEDNGLWQSTLVGLEKSVIENLTPEGTGELVIGVHTRCPACERTGATFGIAEVDADVEIETKHGDRMYYPFYIVHFLPESFSCNVCKLQLSGPDELKATQVPHKRRELTADEMGDFDPEEYLSEQQADADYY